MSVGRRQQQWRRRHQSQQQQQQQQLGLNVVVVVDRYNCVHSLKRRKFGCNVFVVVFASLPLGIVLSNSNTMPSLVVWNGILL